MVWVSFAEELPLKNKEQIYRCRKYEFDKKFQMLLLQM